jgi:hypothetical protein
MKAIKQAVWRSGTKCKLIGPTPVCSCRFIHPGENPKYAVIVHRRARSVKDQQLARSIRASSAVFFCTFQLMAKPSTLQNGQPSRPAVVRN